MKCDCGAVHVNSDRHSDWCSVLNRKQDLGYQHIHTVMVGSGGTVSFRVKNSSSTLEAVKEALALYKSKGGKMTDATTIKVPYGAREKLPEFVDGFKIGESGSYWDFEISCAMRTESSDAVTLSYEDHRKAHIDLLFYLTSQREWARHQKDELEVLQGHVDYFLSVRYEKGKHDRKD